MVLVGEIILAIRLGILTSRWNFDTLSGHQVIVRKPNLKVVFFASLNSGKLRYKLVGRIILAMKLDILDNH